VNVINQAGGCAFFFFGDSNSIQNQRDGEVKKSRIVEEDIFGGEMSMIEVVHLFFFFFFFFFFNSGACATARGNAAVRAVGAIGVLRLLENEEKNGLMTHRHWHDRFNLII
jgi:hypothetical protein